MVLKEAKSMELLVTVAVLAIALYFLYEAIQGRRREYRRLPVLQAIDDGIDRAVEMNRPVFCVMGAYAYLSGLYSAMTLSSVNIMRYTMRQCVRKGSDIYFMLPINPEVGPLIDGIYREVATLEGQPEVYDRDRILYFGNDENAYRPGILNALATYNPATYVAAGPLTGSGDCAALTAARSVGALVVGGQARITHQGEDGPISFDYFMTCADVYAAGAIVSGDPVMQSNLIAADLLTYITVALIILAVILHLAGVPILEWIKF